MTDELDAALEDNIALRDKLLHLVHAAERYLLAPLANRENRLREAIHEAKEALKDAD